MNDSPTQPVSLHALSATTGEPIPDPLTIDRQGRGRALTRPEIDLWLADHATATRHGTASVTMEIAAQLRQEVRDLEIVAHGTLDERLDALSVELLESDDNDTRIAGHLASVALLLLRAE